MKRFIQEIDVYTWFSLYKRDEQFPIVALLDNGPHLDFDEFDFCFENARICYAQSSEDADGYVKNIRIQCEIEGNTRYRQYYDLPKFFSHSVTNHVLAQYAVHKNQNAIKTYLEKAGFSNIKCEFTDNPFNNRKNIWLITAVK